MASTNKTTNYELSQFVETDRPAWLTDYNGDMRTIDSTMKAISDVASGASGSISELADRMSTAEGNISTNANDIDALEARADALEAGAQSTAGTIANIQTEQTAQNLGIEAATELGYNLARPYDSASTYAVGAYVLFQNTLYKCTTAVSTGEAFDPSKWLAVKVTDGMGVTVTSSNTLPFTIGTITMGTHSLAPTVSTKNTLTIGKLQICTFNINISDIINESANMLTFDFDYVDNIDFGGAGTLRFPSTGYFVESPNDTPILPYMVDIHKNPESSMNKKLRIMLNRGLESTKRYYCDINVQLIFKLR